MTTAITDPRRITEADPDFLRIRNRVRRQLASSVNRFAQGLRSGNGDARQQFIHRHVDILYAGYVAAHKAGQQDYWGSVSLQKHPSSDPPHGLVMQRMAFYAPSVTRMALEGESAYHASQARTFADSTPDGGASALDEWQGDLGVRLQLQADLAWSGMQDGYLDGGAGDEANPYAQVWWNLEPLANHCTDCPDLAAGSPYDPPGSGGNELNQTPGDGNTICGANCKCDLTYQPGRGDGAQIGAVLPKNMPSLDQVGGTFAVPNPATVDLTDNQKAGLDALRAAMRQWEKVRGDRPSLPSAFDPEAALDLGDWEDLTPEQQDALDAYLNGLISWSVATNIANLSESFVFFNPNHNPPGPGGGQFAPKGGGGGGGEERQVEVKMRASHEAIHKVFGRDMTEHDFAHLVGAPDRSLMTVFGNGDMVHVDMHGELLANGEESFFASRSFYRDEQGQLVASNQSFRVDDSLQGQGMATKMFSEEVQAMREHGADRIVTNAARGPAVNGYYTWARMGYNMRLSAEIRASMPRLLRGRSTLQELMRDPVGRSWWRAHGKAFQGTFDLHDGSPSMRALSRYLRQKGIHMHLSESGMYPPLPSGSQHLFEVPPDRCMDEQALDTARKAHWERFCQEYHEATGEVYPYTYPQYEEFSDEVDS